MIAAFCGKDYVVLFLPFAHLEQKESRKRRIIFTIEGMLHNYYSDKYCAI